jgi:cation diffusion facilitator CzcD-associated flavoprotein CzcO
MSLPANSKVTGGRLDGATMNAYMESFAETFLNGRIRFNVEITKAVRDNSGVGGWTVYIQDKISGDEEKLRYDKIVVCTGVNLSHSIRKLSPYHC